ncbi:MULTISPECIES: zinc-dependent alcohol dehydrogenase family protein [unclassified Streptomyces]|uniref:zinc-dependent alcohol dehydrogenase family protein n=1 Tax=unclassified Streptomyces TaxID=2593676 RepID=UPI0008914710|nr:MULTISPECIES: zinc-dependent alcohol dehydrogenase family protein [unclassified Streptomyces]MDX2730397.1 zinc-dependent alcohol dehydrogenase family protein [Streptomyces sp. PA03-2a]MDX3769082.1 zinc-dependent alcohol dehydrogenase family protein [Streptomyces sp. AK08-01B]MDX3815514.1 zinc-dependent alcohol dehydrogenase family protein [Streptomyces sp. AK08-01A]SCX96405.1 alcohol dehydrogenase, propanol-preferring [Streptomyces sp. 136MFCol5.1]
MGRSDHARQMLSGWAVGTPGPMRTGPLVPTHRPVAAPGPDELLLEVEACGVCRTDLHLAEGDLTPHRPSTIPGHEIVGRVASVGEAVSTFRVGDRAGGAWLRGTCGTCRYCRAGQENLCPGSTYTGWDADGGFADLVLVPEAFAYRLPEAQDAALLAPLLCAGIIGYRSLRRSALPTGGRLGIYGFGASAHLAAQVALSEGATVHVMTRSAQARELAMSLGASSVSGAYESPPEPLDSAILFAPVGDLVPVALEALDRSGTLAIAGIHLSDIPVLNYQRHLFQERNLRSVTSNTRQDGREFLELAERIGIQVTVSRYPLDRADQALTDLASDRVNGAAVLTSA